VPERRNDSRRAGAGSAAWLGADLLARLVRRPVDCLAILGAAATSIIIVVNAVFLQSHSRSAPFLANPTPRFQPDENRPNAAAVAVPKPGEWPLASATGAPRAGVASARRNDPIAELISASVNVPPRLVAVQRILSEFGYGQIKPTGVLDGSTSAAIEKFETEHKLPVTGRLSDRLLGELTTMIGHPIQ